MEDQARPFPDADPALVYDLAKHRLDIQLSSVDALNNLLVAGLSLATGLIAVVLAVLGLRASPRFGGDSISTESVVLLILAGSAYIASASQFFMALLQARSWSLGPTTRAVWDLAEEYRDRMDLLRWAVVESLDRSYQENEPQYRQKAQQVARGFALIGLQLLLAAALVIETL